MKISKNILKIGILVGVIPIFILLFTNGLNVLFEIGTWVHPYLLIVYGVSLIILGLRLLVMEYGNISNLFKKEFLTINFDIGSGNTEAQNFSKKTFISILGIFVGVSTLLLTSTLL